MNGQSATRRARIAVIVFASSGVIGGCNALLDNGYAEAEAADASTDDATTVADASVDAPSMITSDAASDAAVVLPACDASVDYTSDPFNCGGCGHACGAKKCLASECARTMYVGPVNGPTHLALGSTTIFWSSATTIGSVNYDGGFSQSQSIANTGGTNPIAVAPTSGKPDTLLVAPRNAVNGNTDFDFCQTLSSCGSMATVSLPGNVTSLVQGQVTVYVGYDGGIEGDNIALGMMAPLPAAMGDSVERMEVTANGIFWLSRGVVKSTDFAGVTPTTVANGPAPVSAFSLFKETVVAFGTTAGEIRMCTIGSTCPTSTLVTKTQAAPRAVVLDNGAAYWAEGDTLKKCTKPFPCAQPAITLAGGQSGVREIAVDATALYWVSYGDDAGVGGSVQSVPK